MLIQTSRFGTVDVEDSRLLTLPTGLLGFPQATRFALLQTGEENYFFWLQSVDEPDLAFVVTDPTTLLPDYTVDQIPLREEVRDELDLPVDLEGDGLAARTQVLAICNRVGDWLTGNLLGPIVMNVENRRGKQIVLTEKRWGTRQPLLKLGTPEQQMRKSA